MMADARALTRREMAMGGLLVLLMKSLFSTTLLKGALERRAKNLYSWTHQTSPSGIGNELKYDREQTTTSAR